MQDHRFLDLLERTRRGDGEAAGELLREYEPHIRRVLRANLRNSSLRSKVDSVDICQSVMGTFFVNVAHGRFEIETSTQLIQLLVTMAKRRLFNEYRRYRTKKRDEGLADGIDVGQLPAKEATPSANLAHHELLATFRSRLTQSEIFIADRRKENISWADIARELNSNENALRAKLSRGIKRVSRELNLIDLE